MKGINMGKIRIDNLSDRDKERLLTALIQWICGDTDNICLENIDGAFKKITTGKEVVKCEVQVHDADEYSFERAWSLYDKKVGRAKCEKKWNKLPYQERKAAMEYIPFYVAATKDKQFRKNFETFINNKSWNDEIIYGKRQSQNDRLSAITERLGKIRESDSSFKG